MIDAPNAVFDVKSMPWIRWAQRLFGQHDSRLDRLEEASGNGGSAFSALKQWVGDALSSIQQSVTDTVNNVLANYSTTSQMNTAIGTAISGNITPNTVTSNGETVNGTATFNGNMFNVTGKNTPVTSGFVATYYNSDGRYGATASSGAVKTDLTPIQPADLDALMALTPYWGRYIWDSPDSPRKAFLLAEDVQAAGFGPDVAPVVEGDQPMNIGLEDDPVLINPGTAWTINEAKLVPVLLAITQNLAAENKALTARLDAAGL